jgi:hypothetical protein|tara:strand:+ start:351 stop:656 length:306 start_codon:yes stop_codon:yes gene_type:complete
MKKFFLVFGLFLFISTSVLAEYILEPANCTLKKKSDCGAYLYNNKTGATYFCNIEGCKEIMPQIEESTSSGKEVKESKKSKIPKFKKKKKSKIPKFKKKSE